jgi:hypothetical protein
MSRIKTVIQQTSKTTAVTCNAYDATIQTVPLNDAADTSFSFQVNNSYVQDISAILLSPQYPLTTGTTTRTVTLTGTSGTANITIAGVNYLATFTTNLTTSAANFVTSHGATLLALGYTVTSSAAVITISALTSIFPTVTITNATGDLAGTLGTQTNTATTGLPHVTLVSYQRGSFIVRVTNVGTTAFNNAVSFTYKLTHN